MKIEDENVLTNYLYTYFDEVAPIEFYRDIFNHDLQEKGVYEQGRYNAIAVEVTKEKKEDGKNRIMRHTITDDLDKIDEMCSRDNFCLMSPISYVGKARNSDNARVLYAIAVDLDGVIIKADGRPQGLIDLFHQIENIKRIPLPTYIVSSGTGLHLYYVFEKPILLYHNVVEQLQKFKHRLTDIIWQGYITKLEDNVQFESLFQGFRVVGTITKRGTRARAFLTGRKVSMDYLNEFVENEYKVSDINYKSKLSLAAAKEKYPEWYEKRIVKKQAPNIWHCNRAVYDWWKDKILKGSKVGHRYYCLMCLSVYARKCGISEEELQEDAFELLDFLDNMSESDDNRFTEGDVLDSLEAFQDKYITFPIDTISRLTDIPIEKNKRNYRSQDVHLARARAVQMIDYPNREWINKDGRPKGSGTKKDIIKAWREEHPSETKAECHRQTKIDPKTIRKWWDWTDEKEVEVIQEVQARREEPKRQEIREEQSFDTNAYLERINANNCRQRPRRLTLEEEMALAEQREKRYEEEDDEPLFNFKWWKK